MYEKEAEIYALSNYGFRGKDSQRVLAAKIDYQKGAEFGYNKANEWHKPSEKLPEECSLVLAYDIADKEPSLYYFVASDQWEWLPRRIVFLSNSQIKRWKEIVPPKETE